MVVLFFDYDFCQFIFFPVSNKIIATDWQRRIEGDGIDTRLVGFGFSRDKGYTGLTLYLKGNIIRFLQCKVDMQLIVHRVGIHTVDNKGCVLCRWR